MMSYLIVVVLPAEAAANNGETKETEQRDRSHCTLRLSTQRPDRATDGRALGLDGPVA